MYSSQRPRLPVAWALLSLLTAIQSDHNPKSHHCRRAVYRRWCSLPVGACARGLDLLGVCRHGNYGTCLLVRERTEGVLYALKRIPIGNGKKEESKAALREAQV